MTVNLYEEIGVRIRHARESKHWTQADLGEYMNPPRSHAAVSDIERGQTRLDLNELVALAALLDKPPAYFLKELSTTAYFPPDLPRRAFVPPWPGGDYTGISYLPAPGWLAVLDLDAAPTRPNGVVLVPVVAFMIGPYTGRGGAIICDPDGTPTLLPLAAEHFLAFLHTTPEGAMPEVSATDVQTWREQARWRERGEMLDRATRAAFRKTPPAPGP